MREEMMRSPQEMHGEAWWMRLMDDELTEDEQEQWRVHLQDCARCQREWVAFTAADAALAVAPAAPPLPATFTSATVAKIVRQQRLRRLASFAGGALIVGLVTLAIVSCLGATYSALERSIGAVLSARHMLFQSLIQTLVALVLGFKAVLPYIVGVTLILYLTLMPQGVVVTAVLLWLSQRRQATGMAAGESLVADGSQR